MDWGQVAGEFTNACATLQQDLTENSNTIEAMSHAREKLGSEAAAIYGVWEANPFLRSAELGLGLIEKSKSPKIEGSGTSIHPRSPGGWDVYFDYPYMSFSSPAQNCLFKGTNYAGFAEFYKVLPLILPDGRILAFGPGNGVLSSGKMTVAYSPLDRVIGLEYPLGTPESGQYIFTNESPSGHIDGSVNWNDEKPSCRLAISLKAIEFTPNQKEKVLENQEREIKLHPVPFSAANGIRWRGQSFSTNLASMEDLRGQLDRLQTQLKEMPAWGLTSDTLNGTSLGLDKDGNEKPYQSSSIRTHYLGLVDESEFNRNSVELPVTEVTAGSER